MVEFERTTQLRKKIKFENQPTLWCHCQTRSTDVFETLRVLSAHDGILCVSAVEKWLYDGKAIDQLWIGFVHQGVRNNGHCYPDLEQLVANELFVESLENCYGLFTLSLAVKYFLLRKLKYTHPNLPVVRILYPLRLFPKEKKFSLRKFGKAQHKNILLICNYFSNLQTFIDLTVPNDFQKYLLKSSDVTLDNKMSLTDIVVKENINDDNYDELLCSSIVFLDHYDAPTVAECISRNTPILVNRLHSSEDYIGNDYPLLFGTLNEAEKLLCNGNALEEATDYLERHPLALHVTNQSFLEAFAGSSIYRSLPLPPSQQHDVHQTKFPRFDLTIVICSYKRVYNLENLFDCFVKQDYQGSFEMILWNNNSETQAEVAKIAAPYMKKLNIRLIQSSQNYYCIIRLAVANLMQSDLLLICDDDVVPGPNYITTFLSKYEQYGPKAAICCRGHVFAQHLLHEEDPHQFWKTHYNEYLKFCSEKQPDRQVRCVT